MTDTRPGRTAAAGATTVATRQGGDSGADGGVGTAARRRPGRLSDARVATLLRAGLVVVLLLALVARFVARSPLWLDESQSVAIARLPLHDLSAALRQDGSPPLYYLLLHGWIRLLGQGSGAVRALSGALSVVTFPPFYLLARRLLGQRPAVVAVVLLATSPFDVRFATETRMYSLLVLLTVLGGLALTSTLRRPTPGSVIGLAVCSGLLALTHYWCFYLLATVGIGLVVSARTAHGEARRRAWTALAGLVGGGVLFLPWLPAFLFQGRHTGTPWGEPATFAAVVHAYGEWAGGPSTSGRLLLVVLAALGALGAFGTPAGRGKVVLDLHGHSLGRVLFAVATGTLVVAIAAGRVLGNAYADRYTATAFVPFLLLVALGSTCLVEPRALWGVVGLAAVLGLACSIPSVRDDRTQALQVAQRVERLSAPGDVVLVCPDQLGPALARVLPPTVRLLAVPTLGPADRVDWVDYTARNRGADGAAVADRALALAGPGHRVFLAVNESYRTYERLCPAVLTELKNRRPAGVEVLPANGDYENESLDLFPAARKR